MRGIGLGFFARALAGSLRIRWRQLHSRATRLGQSDRNGLLGRPRAVLSLAHMMDLFAYEFACLDGRRFALGLVFARSSQSFLFWHLPSPWNDGFNKKWGNSYAIVGGRRRKADGGGRRLINSQNGKRENFAHEESRGRWRYRHCDRCWRPHPTFVDLRRPIPEGKVNSIGRDTCGSKSEGNF